MDERERWNARYAARRSLEAGEPNRFLREHLTLLPRGHVLELAMGEGHHAIFLAQRGFSVTGIDISEIAVARALRLARRAGVSINAGVMDLRTAALPPETYDVVICFYYLHICNGIYFRTS
jgi:tellurite methyltransferase